MHGNYVNPKHCCQNQWNPVECIKQFKKKWNVVKFMKSYEVLTNQWNLQKYLKIGWDIKKNLIKSKNIKQITTNYEHPTKRYQILKSSKLLPNL